MVTPSRSRMVWTSLLACAVMAAAPALGANYYWDADADATTGTGGTGIWDASTSLWRSGSATGTLMAWPNTNPAVDAAFLAGTLGTLTLDTGATIYVNTLSVNTANYVVTGGVGSVLAFTGTNPTINANINMGFIFQGITIDVSSGLRITQNGAATPMNFNSGTVFTGAGKVTISSDRKSVV